MRLITTDDLSETYSKIRQKGKSFLVSKFNIDPLSELRGHLTTGTMKVRIGGKSLQSVKDGTD